MFSSDTPSWPHISDGWLVVEKVPIVQFKTFTSHMDQLLTWGAAFTVFAQAFSRLSIRMTGHLMCSTVVQTDKSAPPKQWALLADYV